MSQSSDRLSQRLAADSWALARAGRMGVSISKTRPSPLSSETSALHRARGGLEGKQAVDERHARKRDDAGGDGERNALAHKVALGAGNVDVVIARLNRSGVVGLALKREVVVVVAGELVLGQADLGGILA